MALLHCEKSLFEATPISASRAEVTGVPRAESRRPESGDSSSCREGWPHWYVPHVPGVIYGPSLTLLSETILAAQGGTTIWKHNVMPFSQERSIRGRSYLDCSPCATKDIFSALKVTWSFCGGKDSALPCRGFSSIAHISGVNNSFCLFSNTPMGLFELVQASSVF